MSELSPYSTGHLIPFYYFNLISNAFLSKTGTESVYIG